jgi:hypothetical protein
MRVQLTGPWPINGGAMVIPTSTILSNESGDWTYNGIALPYPPPPNAAVLNQQSYDQMREFYSPQQILIAGDVPHRG